MSTPPELQIIRDRLNAATNRLWIASTNSNGKDFTIDNLTIDDVKLIFAARQDLAALLDIATEVCNVVSIAGNSAVSNHLSAYMDNRLKENEDDPKQGRLF